MGDDGLAVDIFGHPPDIAGIGVLTNYLGKSALPTPFQGNYTPSGSTNGGDLIEKLGVLPVGSSSS